MYNRLYYLRENLVTRDLKCRNGGMDSFVLVKMEGHKKCVMIRCNTFLPGEEITATRATATLLLFFLLKRTTFG